jgi:hypothetical protein
LVAACCLLAVGCWLLVSVVVVVDTDLILVLVLGWWLLVVGCWLLAVGSWLLLLPLVFGLGLGVCAACVGVGVESNTILKDAYCRTEEFRAVPFSK